MTSASTITTAENLLAAGDIGRCELVRGELVMMTPAGEEHGLIVGELALQIGGFVKEHRLGRVYGAETGFRLSREPDTVRAPDVAFVTSEQLKERPPGRGFREGAPSLAVEVISPRDVLSEVQAKVQNWLAGGAREVWVVDPNERTVSVWRWDGAVALFKEADLLTSQELLPGFRLALADLFE